MSKSKSKTTSNQTTNQTATTTPNTPSWLQQPWQDYTGKVTDLMNSGQSLVAGPSDLQNQAFQGAAGLSTSPWYDQAAGMAAQAGGAGANTTGAAAQAGTTGYQGQGYNAAQGQGQGYQAQNASGQGYTAAQTGSQGYQAAGPAGGNTYQAAQGQGQGYNAQTYNPATGQAANSNAANAGQAQTYNPATGRATNANAANAGQAQGYNPNLVDWSQLGIDGVNVGPMAQGSTRDMDRADIDRLMNTGLNDMVDASRADYESQAGMVRAAQSGQAAMNGGARNSNNAIMQAVTEGELSRAQNTGLAGLRYDAYNTAAGLAQSDLARSASMSQFNAGQTNQGLLTQAQLDANRNNLTAQLGQTGLLANQNAANTAGQFNAGAQNDFSLANAGFQQQTNLQNANAANQFGLANMDAQNQAGQFNAGQTNNFALANSGYQQQSSLANQAAQNQFGLANMDAQNQAGQFNAGSQNAASQFGANAQNQFGLANMDAQNAAGQFNAGSLNQSQLDAAGRNDAASQFGAAAGNQAGLFNAGAQNDASQFNSNLQAMLSQFNAGAQNDASQFGANAQNQFGLANMDAANQASQFGANAQNQANQFNAGSLNNSSQFNAAAQNQNNQFNAGQQDSALARQLQAAGLLGNLGQAQGADQRANVGVQAGLGQTQRDIANQTSEASNLAMIQALLSGVPMSAFVGQTSTGNSTSNGTNTTTSTPSLLSQIGQGASTAASVAALFSDRRLKTDIEPVRRDGRGRQWYRYRYLWDEPGTVHEGVMAQEVMATDPQAVGERDGFMTVNYSMLEAA